MQALSQLSYGPGMLGLWRSFIAPVPKDRIGPPRRISSAFYYIGRPSIRQEAGKGVVGSVCSPLGSCPE